MTTLFCLDFDVNPGPGQPWEMVQVRGSWCYDATRGSVTVTVAAYEGENEATDHEWVTVTVPEFASALVATGVIEDADDLHPFLEAKLIEAHEDAGAEDLP